MSEALSFQYFKPISYHFYERLLSYLPEGDYYGKDQKIIPFEFYGSEFVFTTSYPGVVHQILVNGSLQYELPFEDETQNVKLKLAKGRNEITFRLKDDKVTAYSRIYKATVIGLLMYSLMQEFRRNWLAVIQLRSNILSRYHLLLADIKVPERIRLMMPSGIDNKALSLRHLIYHKNHPLTTGGTVALATGLSGAAPVIEEVTNSTDYQPDTDYVRSGMRDISGTDFHLWRDAESDQRRAIFLTAGTNLETIEIEGSTLDTLTYVEDTISE